MYMYICIYIYMYMYIYIYTYIYTYVYIYICNPAHRVCICIYIYIYISCDGQAERRWEASRLTFARCRALPHGRDRLLGRHVHVRHGRAHDPLYLALYRRRLLLPGLLVVPGEGACPIPYTIHHAPCTMHHAPYTIGNSTECMAPFCPRPRSGTQAPKPRRMCMCELS